MNPSTTPIVLIVFNRPELTQQVFNAIREERPPKLFLVGDGPRAEVAADQQNCASVRRIVSQIDWPCEVLRRFQHQNIGLRRNVSEGLDWVFEQVERAIILEDDCLPDPSFFTFCNELLEFYADEVRVGAIAGTNFDPAQTMPAGDESYRFSCFCHIWGWATWRRAWQLCDHTMKQWPAVRETDWLKNRWRDSAAENFWRRHFDDGHDQPRDGLQSWDIAWLFACWRSQLLTVIPRNNLITNLGFGASAVHTQRHNRAALLARNAMKFPLRHPVAMKVDAAADCYIQQNFFEGITPLQRLYWKLRLPMPISAGRKIRRWVSIGTAQA